LRRQIALPPLPPMSPPEAPEPLPTLQPLRSQSGQVAPLAAEGPEEEEETPAPPAPLRAPTVLPRPVKTSSLNLPLVACLLFVVGLLLWREQTRPAFETEMALP